MDENLDQNINPSTEPVAVTPTLLTNQPPFGSWWKVVGLVVSALLVAGSLFFTGYQYFQKQVKPTVSPTVFPTPTPTSGFPAKIITDKQTYRSSLGYSFEYSKDWQVNTFVVKKSETKRRPNKYDVNATRADIEVVEISKGDWIIEVQASSNPEPESCGYQGPIYGDVLNQYKSLSILNKQAARLDLENGYYWQTGDAPEPYPQPIMFPKPLSADLKQKLNITGEALNYHWCTENPSNNLQLSFVYYSDNFTEENITSRQLNTQILAAMDQILSTFRFLD